MVNSLYLHFKKNLLLYSAIILFVLYFSLAAGKPHGIFWSLDEGGKFIYLQNVLITEDPGAPLNYPGEKIDQDLVAVPLFYYSRQGNSIYSWWQPGFPLLSLPFFKLFGWIGIYILPALSGALTAYFSGKVAASLAHSSKWLPVMCVFIVGLSTPVLYYSTTFWEHSLAALFFISSVFYLLQALQKQSSNHLALSSFLMGMGVFFRQEILLFALGIVVALLIANWRNSLVYGFVFLLSYLAGQFVNNSIIGQATSQNVSSIQAASILELLKKFDFNIIPAILVNSASIGAFSLSRLLLFIGTLLILATLIMGSIKKYRSLSLLPFLGFLGISIYVLVQPGLYRSVHGFVLICPLVMLFSWLISTEAWEKQKQFWMLMAGGLILFAGGFTIRAWYAAGGLQWGPRYLLFIYPLFITIFMVGLQDHLINKPGWIKRLTIVVIVISIIVGLGYQIRGYMTMKLTMDLYKRSELAINKLDNAVITTDCTWLAMVIPDLYWKGNIFTNVLKEQFQEELKAAGISRYIDVWMTACNTQPIDEVILEYRSNPSGLVINELEVK